MGRRGPAPHAAPLLGRPEASTPPDVIGIGALNLDYIVPRRQLSPVLRARLDERLGENDEDLVDDDLVDDFIRGYGTDRLPEPNGALGGSAFNAIRTICELELDLRVGFVGVVGRPEGDRFLEYFEKRGVDCRYLFTRDHVSSKCFAEVRPTKQRRLLTGEGATRFLVECLAQRAETEDEGTGRPFPGLSKYLASARWVHLTSFHRLTTLEFLTEHLREAKRLNPGLRLSFDPGHQYVRDLKEEVKEVVRLADYLFVSEDELRHLARVVGTPGEEVALRILASRLLSTVSPPTQVVALKQRSATLVIRWHGGHAEISKYWHRSVLPIKVVDDVGAGDVFAGGFIAGHLAPVFDEFGRGPVKLAAALVRSKLQRTGADGYAEFATIAGKQIRERRAAERRNVRDRLSLYTPIAVPLLVAFLLGLAGNATWEWLRSVAFPH